MRSRLNPAWVAYANQPAAVTGFSLHPAENGPASSTADATDYVMGLSFVVTGTGRLLLGYRWWVADSAQSAGPQDFGLWLSGGPSSGVFSAGSKITSGAFGLGWNTVLYGSGIALTAGQEYRAVTHTLGSSSGKNGYSATAAYWSAGPGASGIVNGPLTGYSAPGNTNGEPSTDGQMTFTASATDVTASYPHDSVSGNYWLDVLVA